MILSLTSLVCVALAHDCPCECLQEDGDVPFPEVIVEVPDDFQKPATSAAVEEQPVEAPAAPSYAIMLDIHVDNDGVVTHVTLGEATPNFLVDRALDEKGIENEWLEPLTCTELDRVEDALYARHRVDFSDDADEAFFAAATVGIYKPVPNLTREGAEYFFSSQDKLTQLRVNNAQASANCSD